MENVIVVFPKIEDARNIRNILVKNGIDVYAVCTSGAQALEYLNMLNSGIVVCSYRFSDMYYTQLRECMPSDYDMLLIASKGHWLDSDDIIVKLGVPIRPFDLINTVHMMFEAQLRRRKRRNSMPTIRSDEQMKVIKEAKAILMDRNHMTEDEAHRYIQKCSMDSGNSLVESAHMVICLYRE